VYARASAYAHGVALASIGVIVGNIKQRGDWQRTLRKASQESVMKPLHIIQPIFFGQGTRQLYQLISR